MLLLGVALWRSGVGPRWAAVCVVLFPLSDVLLSVLPLGEAPDWISNAFGVLGLGALGLWVLRMTEADWETPFARPQDAVAKVAA